ncbi:MULTISPECIES: Bug family tripartite tricarboxylate transporter substrate binding protein [unclassified Variovorax]|uniref:Bug family tripartite tricarboxylate transporter substrate binding protein n=1 Tax=unclassified Variovorax TaxID=663243 RepID=UPI003F446A20
MMKTISALLVATGIAMLGQSAAAEGYPSKPIRIVVPYTAGGGPDSVARDIATKVTANTKWNFIVDNRAGSGGNIGTENVVRSPADGYSLLLGQTAQIAINPSLYGNLSYDTLKDLVPISFIGPAPLLVVVAADSPYKTLADVVAASRKRPGGINFATSGNGTVAHLIGEMFQKDAGVKMTHVPYRGVSQGISDVLGGNVELYISSMPTLIGFVRSGKLRALAVTSRDRAPDLPNVPTVAESGYKNFEAVSWFGVLGPAKLPADVVSRLNVEINKALKDPELRKKLASQGLSVEEGTPEAFAKRIREDHVRWGNVVRESGAKVE